MFKIVNAIVALVLFCGCKDSDICFKSLTPSQSGIDFSNTVEESERFNILTYPYAMNGAGVAIADFDNDGWEDVFFASNKRGGNRLFRNMHAFRFRDVSEEAGIAGKSDWHTGVTVVDINNDGWNDIYICAVHIPGLLEGGNELYVNDGKGAFREEAKRYGLDFKGHSTQSLFFDYDRDGDIDCFLLNHSVQYAEDFRSISSRKTRDSLSGNRLLRNDNGYFIDVSDSAGIIGSPLNFGLGIGMADIDGDGWPDLYASSDFKENDVLYINNRRGGFSDGTGKLGHVSRFSMGNDIADVNNDGWQDIVTVDMLAEDEKILKSSISDDDFGIHQYKLGFGFHEQLSRNCLQLNRGGVFFQDLALQKGVAATDWSWAPLLADWNNDGLKDLYVSNGYRYRANDLDFNTFVQGTYGTGNIATPTGSKLELIRRMPDGFVPDKLYMQSADGGFIDVSGKNFLDKDLCNGAAYADLDRDGKLDLVVNRLNDVAAVYRNISAEQQWLQVKLVGERNNRQGIGARLELYANGVKQVLSQSPTRGFMSSVSPILQFGLGFNSADSLKVTWASGKQASYHNIRNNSLTVLLEKDALSLGSYTADPVVPVKMDTSVLLPEVIIENEYNDMIVQPLLPHSMSVSAPVVISADVNGDGLDDLYVTGNESAPGALWVQGKDGRFTCSLNLLRDTSSRRIETNAVFFDADGDKDFDLFIASGGNKYFGRNEKLLDQLLVNDGSGKFSQVPFPALYENKSAIAVADFDRDGDMDLFLGGKVNGRSYGFTPASSLLLNNGKGVFTEHTEDVAPGLQYVGMVSDACFADVDGNGWEDLVLAGEWMPVTIFLNHNGKFIRILPEGLKGTNGWWTMVKVSDMDGDGRKDLLLGNWGDNSKIRADRAHPLNLFLNDWDGNGEQDPLLCVFKQGRYFTFLGKNELERSIPFIRKRYLNYGDVAGRPVDQLFNNNMLEEARILETTCMYSSIAWNNRNGWLLEQLPSFLQVSPIIDAAEIGDRGGRKFWLTAGNVDGVGPYEGRYDALMPTIFSVGKDRIVKEERVFHIPGVARKISSVKTGRGKIWVISRRKAPLISLSNIELP